MRRSYARRLPLLYLPFLKTFFLIATLTTVSRTPYCAIPDLVHTKHTTRCQIAATRHIPRGSAHPPLAKTRAAGSMSWPRDAHAAACWRSGEQKYKDAPQTAIAPQKILCSGTRSAPRLTPRREDKPTRSPHRCEFFPSDPAQRVARRKTCLQHPAAHASIAPSRHEDSPIVKTRTILL
ncbi:hypothetical protein B0H13DRAFT_1019634 [Mycena leptocephala]|nr:hypothetical protein B0H13DRAFT_1019634 [Mycena leptocephala]